MYRTIILYSLILAPFYVCPQEKGLPPVVRLDLNSHTLQYDIDQNGKGVYSKKVNDQTLKGKQTIHNTILDTGSHLVGSYHQTGYTSIGTFNDNGHKNGTWKTVHKNILVKTEHWDNGSITGTYQVYDIHRNLLYGTNFGTNGNGTYKTYDHKTGAIIEEGEYLNGKKNSKWCTYDSFGNIISKKYYKNGLKTGIWYTQCTDVCNYTHYTISFNSKNYGEAMLYKGEKLWQKGERYLHRVRNGTWIIYDGNETPLHKYVYKNDTPIITYKRSGTVWLLDTGVR